MRTPKSPNVPARVGIALATAAAGAVVANQHQTNTENHGRMAAESEMGSSQPRDKSSVRFMASCGVKNYLLEVGLPSCLQAAPEVQEAVYQDVALPAPTISLQQLEAVLLHVTLANILQWNLVHVCEEPDWNEHGSVYSGGLGISNTNWIYFRDLPPKLDLPDNAGDANPVEQIAVAMRIRPNPPDQNGCAGSW